MKDQPPPSTPVIQNKIPLIRHERPRRRFAYTRIDGTESAAPRFTVVADAIGIAAILDRLMEYGTTPNRLAVLGGNLVFLGTLATLLVHWFQGRGGSDTPERITRNVMNKALVVFIGWTATVLLVFPLVFGAGLESGSSERFKEALASVQSVQETEIAP